MKQSPTPFQVLRPLTAKVNFGNFFVLFNGCSSHSFLLNNTSKVRSTKCIGEFVFATSNFFRGGNQSQGSDHSGFAVPSAPVGKGRFGSQNSLQASGSRGSSSDLSQTDSNPDLHSSARKLSSQSNPDQTPRRGSAADRFVC